jgi:hypothetical protein
VDHLPAEVASALLDAAKHRGVPYTLLCALAWEESGFDPSAVASSPSGSGEGLFQFSPQMLETYDLALPFDAVKAADAGALLLRRLGRGTRPADDAAKPPRIGWMSAIDAFYFAAHSVPKERRKPKLVAEYTANVMYNREELQATALPVGATIAERLGNAIDGLAAANPTDADARALASRWHEYADNRTILDETVLELPALKDVWKDYQRTYDLAVVTDSRTPLPRTVQPTLHGEVEEVKGTVSHAAHELGSGALTALEFGALGLLAVLGILIVRK